MRAIVIAAVAALGIGIVGTSAGMAGPMNGWAIGQAAGAGEYVAPAHWYGYRHHHRPFFFRHHHRRWW